MIRCLVEIKGKIFILNQFIAALRLEDYLNANFKEKTS